MRRSLKHCWMGFTMIELLVAMAVLALLVVMLLGIVESGTKLWRENEGRIDSYREARAALGIISRDLANTIAANSSNNFFINGTLNANAFSKLVNVQNLETNTNYAGAALFLASFPRTAQFSTNPNENKSDVCEVGYFLAFGKTSAVTAGVGTNQLSDTLNLYRYFLGSDATYSNLLANTVFGSPNPTLTGDRTELLARNITAFQITAFSTNTNGQLVAFTPTTNQPLPVLIDVSITAVNQDTAKRLGTAKSAWLDTNSLPVKQSSQTFSTRVRIPANP
jgi:prepilin-type N-terminal cleavage/methylation domain-containing protein